MDRKEKTGEIIREKETRGDGDSRGNWPIFFNECIGNTKRYIYVPEQKKKKQKRSA